MSTTQYVWFNDNPDFEKNFLEYLIGHHKINGDAPVSWTASKRAESHICGSGPKKFPALKNKRENRFKQLTAGLEAMGVVVDKLKNSYTWSVPDVAVRNRLEIVLASAPKDWLEIAEELVEEYASVFSEVGINMAQELARAQGEGTTKTQTAATWAAWFRKNRLPALESSRWYLRGVNREGTIRNSAPFSGYIE